MGILKKVLKEITKPVVNNHKGKVGERKVSQKLNPLLFGKVEHRQLNDIIIVDEMGKSHQIDHIEIRRNGIFCIETKNYKGWILGSENQDKWTQVLYTEKHQFVNPIKQNKSHIFHLKKLLNNEYKINSIIVMVQNNADKIDVDYVVNLDDLKTYLNDYFDGTIYSIDELDIIYNKILEISNKDITNKEHLKNIKQTQMDIRKNICPRCGGQLLERKGAYGVFIGCSNYPNCKFKLKN